MLNGLAAHFTKVMLINALSDTSSLAEHQSTSSLYEYAAAPEVLRGKQHIAEDLHPTDVGYLAFRLQR